MFIKNKMKKRFINRNEKIKVRYGANGLVESSTKFYEDGDKIYSHTLYENGKRKICTFYGKDGKITCIDNVSIDDNGKEVVDRRYQ
mgnify:CR=1 FL=1